MATDQLSVIRTNTEAEINLTSSNDAQSYISSTTELKDINDAYQYVAYKYNWPELLVRGATIIIANVRKYNTPTRFRKFQQMFVLGTEHTETEFNSLPFSQNRYAVDKREGSFWTSTMPTSASTAYSLQASYSAGDAVVMTLDTVSGLFVGGEIFINGTTPEFTIVSAVDTTNTTITARIKNATGASKKLYKSEDIIHYQWYEAVALLANSTDVTVLPDATDSLIPIYAAYLYYERLEMYDRAEAKLKKYNLMEKNAFISHDVTATGEAGEFSVYLD